MPHIAISVDMLDTGIDVPEVVNLVFFKVVRSRTKFWQMVGRGTRLCKDLFAPGEHKKFFYLFDYCQNLEFFSQNPEHVDGSASEPLSTRLFKTRLALIEELDNQIKDGFDVREPRSAYGEEVNEPLLRGELATHLQQSVAAMNIDNFVVRPQRRYVEKYAKTEAWQALGTEQLTELAKNVAKLPTELVDDDEDAKRFDMMILRTQLAVLQAKPDFGTLRDNIIAICRALEEQEAVPAIRAQMVLIQSMTSEEWWQDVTVGMLENARKRLRALVKLIEKAKKKIVYTDFEDELGTEAKIDLPEIANGLDMAKFKDKARQFLKAHESHLALQRLRRNQPLTPADLEELERMLMEAGGSKELIAKAAEQSNGLGIFIRSLVGMDREAAMAAFNDFIKGGKATADQLEFINLLVEELTANGVMEPERLYQTPYIDINPQGPDGVFPSNVNQLFKVIADIRLSAVA